MLKTSKLLKDQYSKPIGDNLSSLNFPETFVWFQEYNGNTIDLFSGTASNLSKENLLIAEGGAAAMAYTRLQFEDIGTQERNNIMNALLRYCELDTLAMVMILRAWLDWC